MSERGHVPGCLQPEDQPEAKYCDATPAGSVRWPVCALPSGHDGYHESADYTWPDGRIARLKSAPGNDAPAPRPGCPAWCTGHDAGFHRSRYHFCGVPNISVGVLQSERFDDNPTLYVDGIGVDLLPDCAASRAATMAALMRKMGREDVAAAVDELGAAVAAVTDG